MLPDGITRLPSKPLEPCTLTTVQGFVLDLSMWKTVYDPAMLDTVIELGAQGKSVIERVVALKISRATYYNWISPSHAEYKPEFAEAAAIADELCEAWWISKGRDNMIEHKDGPKLNSRIYQLMMMNQFRWGINTRNENKNTDIVINDGAAAESEHGQGHD